LKVVTHALTRHGYVVIAAEDGLAALRICRERKGPIHLALLDIMMPGMRGPQLYECLKEIHARIAVLFMSGWSSSLVSELAPDMKDVHFIAKPFLPMDLVQRVNEILGNEEICTLLADETEMAQV
jgi:two-component system cell cycle sensor histidine kinase/response regulator CckA